MNSTEKTLAVLRAVSAPGAPHRLADIAADAEVSKTTAHRILQVFVATNYAQARGEGSYAAGPALLALGHPSDDEFDLASVARPMLTQLQHTTGHTVHLAVRTGRAAVYVAKVEGDKPYRMASRVGMQIPLDRTAIGKAILASLPRPEVDAALAPAEPGAARPALSGTRLRKLYAELDAVRAAGYAIDDGENEPNVRCIGAVVRDGSGSIVGGVSVSTLAPIVTVDQLRAFAPAVTAAAGQLSAALGYRG